MPTKIEKDIVTGTDTTGHEWDGLKELNTPLPKWWLYVLYATIAWAAVWFVLYPSVPWRHRLLPRRARLFAAHGGERRRCARSMAQRADTMDRIKALSFAEIRKDPQLMAAAADRRAASPSPTTASPAMAPAAAGSPAFPAWRPAPGSGAARSMRSSRPSRTASAAATTRRATAQMPRFGADGMLKPRRDPAGRRLCDDAVRQAPSRAEDVSAGQKLFADNCAVCHGEAGQGDREKGAPRLASRVHLYGGDRATVVAQITRRGWA